MIAKKTPPATSPFGDPSPSQNISTPLLPPFFNAFFQVNRIVQCRVHCCLLRSPNSILHFCRRHPPPSRSPVSVNWVARQNQVLTAWRWLTSPRFSCCLTPCGPSPSCAQPPCTAGIRRTPSGLCRGPLPLARALASKPILFPPFQAFSPIISLHHVQCTLLSVLCSKVLCKFHHHVFFAINSHLQGTLARITFSRPEHAILAKANFPLGRVLSLNHEVVFIRFTI